MILARYFLIAGGAYLFFYSFWKRSPAADDPSCSVPPWKSIQKDIKLSVFSAIIFSLISAFILSQWGWQVTRLYSHPDQYGLWYLGVSYGIALILQDTYFYFTHRLFHRRSLFRWFHQGHHQFCPPTPLTSFAFDPLEAIAQCLFLVGIVFLIPLHFITLIAVLMTMTIWSVVNHLGLERLPQSFPHHWFGRWFIGPAHHSSHHLNYTVNYGLYFTFWDKILDTQDPDYERQLLD
jgi:sterol desaturase/sphingolipid hydroxylase (fatty acid hydroxylase superfamily)